MKIKQTILALALLVGIGGFLLAPTVSAEICNPGTDNEYQTSIIPCATDGQGGIWGILLLVINILTGGIGIAAIGGIIYGSVLYASAGSDAANIKKAKEIIVNIVIGLVAYAFMFSFLNYLIPGGLFSGSTAVPPPSSSTSGTHGAITGETE